MERIKETKENQEKKMVYKEREIERERKSERGGVGEEKKRGQDRSCILRHKKAGPLRRENNRADGIPAMRCHAQNTSVPGSLAASRIASSSFSPLSFPLSPSNRVENTSAHFPRRLLGMAAVFNPAVYIGLPAGRQIEWQVTVTFTLYLPLLLVLVGNKVNKASVHQ